MTGIEALERKAATKPMRPGLIERVEHEYIRHGTLSLIANFEVATGQVLSPSIGPTRNEADFARHIETTINTDPQAEWVFIVDQLNSTLTSLNLWCVSSLVTAKLMTIYRLRANQEFSNRCRPDVIFLLVQLIGFDSSTFPSTPRG